MPTLIEQKPVIQKRLCPMYKVLLHNDDVHDMEEVVSYILKAVPQVSAQDAIKIMLTAHHTGAAVVIVSPLEHAEMYRDRLESFGLTATLEPEE